MLTVSTTDPALFERYRQYVAANVNSPLSFDIPDRESFRGEYFTVVQRLIIMVTILSAAKVIYLFI